VKEIDFQKLKDYETLVIGAPNHMGRPSQTIKKFINQLGEQDPKARNAAVFGTYSGRVRADRSVKKLEQMLKEKCPALKLILPGLSVKVKGVTGPITEGEMPKCKEFGEKIASVII
jgi:flavorubredoxin